MSVFVQVYLDTNFLIMLGEGPGQEGNLARAIASVPGNGGSSLFVTSELTLSELLVRPYREKNLPLSHFYTQLMRGEFWLRTVPVTAAVLEMAATLRGTQRSLKLPDAIHVATAMSANCSHFLTSDTGIADFDPIPHPFRPITLPALPVIRPDISTLTTILSELSQ